jgi:hypothetical protein
MRTVAASCSGLPPVAFWWLTFAAGLFEHLTADVTFPDIVEDIVMKEDSEISVPSNMRSALVKWISNGSMAQSFVDGTWELMPGLSHPRNLTGCDYLASFEVRMLLNIDLCGAEEYSSIRFMCPVSCGCSVGQVYNYEFFDGGVQFDLMQNLYYVSNRMDDLGSCPAACVMVHPAISGDSSYDSIDVGVDPSETATYVQKYSDVRCVDVPALYRGTCGEACTTAECEAHCSQNGQCSFFASWSSGLCETYSACPNTAPDDGLSIQVYQKQVCEDFPGKSSGTSWSDGYNGCSAYAVAEAQGDNWCTEHGETNFNGEGSAKWACCACGGGLQSDHSVTQCTDLAPDGATDVYGDSCADWAANKWACSDSYDDTDFTLMEMCCQCEGGIRN